MLLGGQEDNTFWRELPNPKDHLMTHKRRIAVGVAEQQSSRGSRAAEAAGPQRQQGSRGNRANMGSLFLSGVKYCFPNLGRDPFVGHRDISMGPLIIFLHFCFVFSK